MIQGGFMDLKLGVFLICTAFSSVIAMKIEEPLIKENNVPQHVINNFIENCQSTPANHLNKIKEGSLGEEYQEKINIIASTKKIDLKKYVINQQLDAAHKEISNLTDQVEQQEKAKFYITNIQKIITQGTKFQ